MLKNRLIVADGESGWEVWLHSLPGWSGPHEVLATGLSEDEADAYVDRLTAEDEGAAIH